MDWLEFTKAFAGPVATVFASVAALVVTWRFSSRQLQIANDQMRVADGQRLIAAARLNFDLYEKRYAVFEAARRLLVDVVQQDHVDAKEIIAFKIATAEAVFLFDPDATSYLDGLLSRVLRFRSLEAQEKAADEYDEEEKRQKLVDLRSAQHQLLNHELAIIIEKFRPYLKLGNI